MMMTIFEGFGLIISVLDMAVRAVTLLVLLLLIWLIGCAINGLQALGRGLIWVVEQTLPQCSHDECIEYRKRRGGLARHWGGDDD
jgi:hypothetical protein